MKEYTKYLRAWCTRCILFAARCKRRGCVFRIDVTLDDPVRIIGRDIQDFHTGFHPRSETYDICNY